MSRMVAISGVAAGTDYLVIRNPGSGTSLGELPTRRTRTPTLDGGAVIYDGGARHADRIATIEIVNATEEEAATARSLWENQTRVLIASEEGAYEGAISRVTINEAVIVINVLIESKRSA